MQTALPMGLQQGEAVVASVIDDHIARSEGLEVLVGGPPLVRVGMQAAVQRQAGAQVVEATPRAAAVADRPAGPQETSPRP